ncbi:MAG: CBS domain-containing protein [Acidimicrobiales bacterium]
MQVQRILASKGSEVTTVAPDTTISDVVAALAKHRIGAIVVSEDGESIAGIVSERDVVRRLAKEPETLMKLAVSEIMTTSVYTCGPEDQMDSLMVVMTDKRIRHVPVLKSDKLIGIISIGDVVKCRLQNLETENQQLVEYISGR